MTHSHLKILEIVEDIDGDGKPRIRCKVQEFQPRTLFVNLKKAESSKIQQLKELVGGDAMLPIREGMMNGQTFFQFIADEEIIPIHLPEKIPVSKTVDIHTSDSKPPLFGKAV